MLTTQFDITSIPWDKNQQEDDRHDAVLFEGEKRAYAVLGDAFHRHVVPETGSLAGYSLAERPDWAKMDETDSTLIESKEIYATGMVGPESMFAVQQTCNALGLNWFHPDSETILAREEATSTYVMLKYSPHGVDVHLMEGNADTFAAVCSALEDKIKQIQSGF